MPPGGVRRKGTSKQEKDKQRASVVTGAGGGGRDKPANKKPTRKPVEHVPVKADTPKRVPKYKAKGGDINPTAVKSIKHERHMAEAGGYGEQPHLTDRERAVIADRLAGYRREYDDRQRMDKYDNSPGIVVVPVPVNARSPRPMIEPGVGPVAQLREQAAHTYGFTPEAYRDMRRIPINYEPHSVVDRYDPSMANVAGAYDPFGDRIQMMHLTEPGVLAHEQAHAFYDQSGFLDNRTQPGYVSAFEHWRDQSRSPDAVGPTGRGYYDQNAVDNEATASYRDLRQASGDGIYPGNSESYQWPTEEYARTVQFSPNSDRSNWPDQVRPYYSGFLQGMDRSQSGGPLAPIRRDYEPLPVPYETPQGSPEQQYQSRPYDSWR